MSSTTSTTKHDPSCTRVRRASGRCDCPSTGEVDLSYVARTHNNLRMYERYLLGELEPQDCPECGGVLSYVWRPYEVKGKLSPVTFVNGVSWGRWWCQWYGQCEAAPG